MVEPYEKGKLIRTDAFRGPLATAFKLHLEDLLGFRDPATGEGLDSRCLRTDGLSPAFRSLAVSAILPDFGCLLLSPANLWGRDPSAFQGVN